jgi:hypothetical protein
VEEDNVDRVLKKIGYKVNSDILVELYYFHSFVVREFLSCYEVQHNLEGFLQKESSLCCCQHCIDVSGSEGCILAR